jgi:hypothetical protein
MVAVEAKAFVEYHCEVEPLSVALNQKPEPAVAEVLFATAIWGPVIMPAQTRVKARKKGRLEYRRAV